MSQNHLSNAPILDLDAPTIQKLVSEREWLKPESHDRIGAVYHFVRDEILFGYNSDDSLPASRVLADGYGQSNTKARLLKALLRAVDIPCRFHGFTIGKGLQRGVAPELVNPIAPRNILHSWVEVLHQGGWLELEGFTLDSNVLIALHPVFRVEASSAPMAQVQTICSAPMSIGAE